MPSGSSAARPNDLRHSAASLWLHEGCSVIEVAAWLGHAPSMTLDTYGHVLAELNGADRVPAEEAIRRAREALVPVSYPGERVRAGESRAKEPFVPVSYRRDGRAPISKTPKRNEKLA